MKPGNIILIILFMLGSIRTLTGQDCTRQENIYQFMFQAKKYEVVKELKSWENAARCAVERGGYLAQINSKAEQDSVYYAIVMGARIQANYKLVSDGGGIAYVWIGATDKFREGTWIWDGNNDNSGTNFWTGKGASGGGGGISVEGLYNNWGGASVSFGDLSSRKEPDDYNQNQDGCAIGLNGWPSGSGTLGIAGEWNDINITNTLYFVIEYDAASNINPDDLRPQVTVFPVPATNVLRVTSAGNYNQIVELRLINILGSIVFSKSGLRTPEYTIDLNDYQAGAYFIRITLENGQSVRRKVMIK